MSDGEENLDWLTVLWSWEKTAETQVLSQETCESMTEVLGGKGVLSNLYEISRDSWTIRVKDKNSSVVLQGHFWIAPMVGSKQLFCTLNRLDLIGKVVIVKSDSMVRPGDICYTRKNVAEWVEGREDLEDWALYIWNPADLSVKSKVLSFSIENEWVIELWESLISHELQGCESQRNLDELMPHRSAFRFVDYATFPGVKREEITKWSIFEWQYTVPEDSLFLVSERKPGNEEVVKYFDPYLYEEVAAQIGTAAFDGKYEEQGKILAFKNAKSLWSGIKIFSWEKISVVGAMETIGKVSARFQYILKNSKGEEVMRWQIIGAFMDKRLIVSE